MRIGWLLLAVVLLAVVGGTVAWRFLATDPPLTLDPSATASEPATPAQAPVAGTDATATDASPAAPRSERTAAPLAPEDARLDVDVLCVEPDGKATLVAAVDVLLEIEGRPPTPPQRTNLAGCAYFDVPRADGVTVTARTARGGEGTVRLRAGVWNELELRITPRIWVTGRVTDPGGRGIADADLQLLPWATRGDETPAPLYLGRSGADGTFRLGLAQGGRIGARHGSYGPSPMHLVRLGTADAPPPTLALQLVLEATAARITGIVVDAGGQPVADAELEFRSSGPAPRDADLPATPVRTISDARGAFRAEPLRAGPIEFGVRARGHGSARGSLQLSGGEARHLRIELPGSCTLTGTVVDADGRPVREARVTAGVPSSFLARTTQTDGAGRYRLTDLGADATPVQAQRQSPNGAKLQATTVLQLAVDRANVWNAVLLPPEATVELRGTLLDRAERPQAGWRIVARNGPRAVAGTSSGDGTFVLVVPAQTSFDLRIHAPGQPANTFADTVLRGIEPGREPLRIVVGAGAWGRLRGSVTTEAQLAVPAAIALWHQERGEYVRTQAADDGTFDLAVPAGRLEATFEHPGCAAALRPELAVAAMEQKDLGVVTLGAAGILHGAVRGADGRAPDQCQLAIVCQNQRLVADYAGGNYRFAAVPTGEHVLQVQGPGLAAATFPVHITAGEERQLDLDLRVGVLRRIRVQAPPGGVDQISLALRPPEQSVQWMSAQSARAGTEQRVATAEFEAWLPEGSYEAIAWSGSRFEARATVQVTAADTGTITLVLQPK